MLLRVHTPSWLYESLPYLYLTGGAFAIYATHNAIGAFCGALLIVVAMVVWQMRHAYRRHAASRRHTRSKGAMAAARAVTHARPASHASSAQLVPLAWNPAFETGHPVIDRQHRLLFTRANELIAAALSDQAEADIALMLDELVLEVDRHFRTEDALLGHGAHPAACEHKALHGKLLHTIRELRELHQSGGTSNLELIRFVTTEVISDHIVHSDLDLVANG